MVFIVSIQALIASAAFQRQTLRSENQGPVSKTLEKGQSPGCRIESLTGKSTPLEGRLAGRGLCCQDGGGERSNSLSILKG